MVRYSRPQWKCPSRWIERCQVIDQMIRSLFRVIELIWVTIATGRSLLFGVGRTWAKCCIFFFGQRWKCGTANSGRVRHLFYIEEKFHLGKLDGGFELLAEWSRPDFELELEIVLSVRYETQCRPFVQLTLTRFVQTRWTFQHQRHRTGWNRLRIPQKDPKRMADFGCQSKLERLTCLNWIYEWPLVVTDV